MAWYIDQSILIVLGLIGVQDMTGFVMFIDPLLSAGFSSRHELTQFLHILVIILAHFSNFSTFVVKGILRDINYANFR